jgi:hypothetical protein
MPRTLHTTRFLTRLLTLAHHTFEASVAIHYDAPWARLPTPVIAKNRASTASARA